MKYETWQMGEEVSQELMARECRVEVYHRGNELRWRYGMFWGRGWHLSVIPHTPDSGHPWTVSIHANRDRAKRILINVDRIEEFPSDLTVTKLMLLSGR